MKHAGPIALCRAARSVLLAAMVLLAPLAAAAQGADLDDVQNARLEGAVRAYQMGDYGKAVDELRPLAEEGVAEAEYYLGFMYAQGLGVQQSYETAAHWYEDAARQGHAQAQNYLGLLYFEGNGVPRSFRDAFIFFELAAAAGNQDAANNRLIVARKMSSAQITEAQKAAGRMIGDLRSKVKKVILPRRTAAGVVVGDDGTILTHASAVLDCVDMTVRFNGEEKNHPARLAASDPFNDLALVSAAVVRPASAVPVTFRDGPVADGETLTVIAYSLDDKKHLVIDSSSPRVRPDPALSRVDTRYLQIDHLFGATFLGAPAFDSAGRLVGLIVPGLQAERVALVSGKPGRTGFVLRADLLRLLMEVDGRRYHGEAAPAQPASAEGGVATAVADSRPAPDQPGEDRLAAATVAIECWREDGSWSDSERTASSNATEPTATVSEPAPTGKMRRRRRNRVRRRRRRVTCDAGSTSPATSCRFSTIRGRRSRRAPSASA